MAREDAALDGIERWMLALVMHPAGVQAGLTEQQQQLTDLERVVLPSQRQSALERMSVYADMYLLRLLEIMADEYPTLCHLLGEELFSKAAQDYLTRYPSANYNLNRLSQRFPQFLLEEAEEIPQRQFAASVATVERAMEEVFDERHVQRIAIEAIFAVAEAQWGDLRLQLSPALRLLTLDYPVNDYMTAVKENRQADVPAAGKTHALVYRCDYTVWRLDLDPLRFALLSQLLAGEPLEAALAACAAHQQANVEQLQSSLGDWFRDWASQGLFCGVTT